MNEIIVGSIDSFWVMDHFHQIPLVGKQDEPMLESWTTVSVLAGVTSKIKLGTMMTGIIYRHPSILAKIGATLDVLSKGRLFKISPNVFKIHFKNRVFACPGGPTNRI
jgi:alkanesulfonate monooxygenase SsuD/methylene tetrahydromethanopterin reductase-like flavin-dependent oxidoreductase (luciferase family)